MLHAFGSLNASMLRFLNQSKNILLCVLFQQVFVQNTTNCTLEVLRKSTKGLVYPYIFFIGFDFLYNDMQRNKERVRLGVQSNRVESNLSTALLKFN